MVEQPIISEETEEKIVNFGALGYPAPKMANILGWKLELVTDLMKDKESQFAELYARGSDIAQYLIDKKLFDMAKAGDIKAMQRWEFKREKKGK